MPDQTDRSQPNPAGVSAPRWSQRRRILIVLCLSLALFVGLVIAGLVAHSVSVLAAAGDTVADCFPSPSA